LVQTELTAISPGTESMIFRGHFPQGIALDATIASLSGSSWSYPLRYGYALVGRIVRVGSAVNETLLGQRVFVFHPHQDHACVEAGQCIPIPDGIDSQAAAMLPNVESAANFVMDAAPLLGERFLVTGQGVVGLLTTAMLATFPLSDLSAVDPVAMRRVWAETLGADRVAGSVAELGADDHAASDGSATAGLAFDGVIELSGNVEALGEAIRATCFDGRIIAGSWYGRPGSPLDLGGVFHRNRIRLISSQVSTIAPQLAGRWTKSRRLALAWDWVRRLDPARLVTHLLPAAQCQDAFELASAPESGALQILFHYPS
jgi:threonine dehydrogenase-like Zn-dependent dehydrogenase